MAAGAGVEFVRRVDAVNASLSSSLGTLNAATAALVDTIAQGLADGVWEAEECRSPEHWLAVRCGVSAARAHRLVRIARRIGEFPLVGALFAAGQVSEDHLDVIATHAHPSQDRDLEIAGCCTIGQLRRFIASLPVPDPDPDRPDDPDDPERVGGVPNVAAFGWSGDGRYRGRVDLDANLGSLLERALRSGRNAVFRARHGHDSADTVEDADLVAVSGPDALEALSRAALDHLDPATASGGRPATRHQVLIHLDAEHPERARIHLGPLLDRATRHELLCDTDLRAVLSRGGRPVALGRRHRVVDPLLRALIEDRDGGCRVPGCDRTRYLHIHHLVHWTDGGTTDPDNLVAVCTEHHRAIHTGNLRFTGDPDTPNPDGFAVLDRHGRPLPRPAPAPPGPPPPTARPYHGPERVRFPRTNHFRWF